MTTTEKLSYTCVFGTRYTSPTASLSRGVLIESRPVNPFHAASDSIEFARWLEKKDLSSVPGFVGYDHVDYHLLEAL